MARLTFLAALALAGCSTACPRPESEEPTDYKGGTVEDGIYMSADWEGEWLHFPGGAYYRIHHGLGEMPRLVVPYLSFERDGLTSGGAAVAAGNAAEVKARDEETVTIVNGSCAEYWLMVVVSTGAPD